MGNRAGLGFELGLEGLSVFDQDKRQEKAQLLTEARPLIYV